MIDILNQQEKLTLAIMVLKEVSNDYQGIINVCRDNGFAKTMKDAQETKQFIEKILNLIGQPQ
jgi:predicted unusual protein kinase regulating ubiquinone biosynthesis (AarF/ABC1/UbiB family)